MTSLVWDGGRSTLSSESTHCWLLQSSVISNFFLWYPWNCCGKTWRPSERQAKNHTIENKEKEEYFKKTFKAVLGKKPILLRLIKIMEINNFTHFNSRLQPLQSLNQDIHWT